MDQTSEFYANSEGFGSLTLSCTQKLVHLIKDELFVFEKNIVITVGDLHNFGMWHVKTE
jgi:hypothetical protein